MARGRVRAFERDDIPQVAALRRRLFSSNAQASAAASEAYFDLVFFSNPWRDLDLPSLVYEDGAGISGFLGVIPRPMRYRGDPVRMAVSTQFMGERGVAGIQLLAHFLDGPQDLCFADAASDAARRIHEGLGGTAAVVRSLHWTFPLRPVRYALSHLGDHRAVRAARFLTRPLTAAADAAFRAAAKGERRLQRPAGLNTTTLEARDVAELLPEMTEGHALVPVCDEAVVRWLLDRLSERQGSGSVCGRLVRTDDGLPVGWYIYQRCDIVGEVVQIAAKPGRWADVLKLLLAEALDDGLGAVAGRLDPRHVDDISALGCTFALRGSWSVTHSRRPELALSVLAGDAFLSRLEAEWWLNF